MDVAPTSDRDAALMTCVVVASLAYPTYQALGVEKMDGGFTPTVAMLACMAVAAPLCALVECASRPSLARLLLSNATRALLCGIWVLADEGRRSPGLPYGHPRDVTSVAWMGVGWFFLVAFLTRTGPWTRACDALRTTLAYPPPRGSVLGSFAGRATRRWYALVLGDPRGVAPSRASLRRDLEAWDERLGTAATAIVDLRNSEAYAESQGVRESVEALLEDFLVLDGVVNRAKAMGRGFILPDVAGATGLLTGHSIHDPVRPVRDGLVKAVDPAPNTTLEQKLARMDARYRRVARDVAALDMRPGFMDRIAMRMRLG